jgi:hypothetical protein
VRRGGCTFVEKAVAVQKVCYDHHCTQYGTVPYGVACSRVVYSVLPSSVHFGYKPTTWHWTHTKVFRISPYIAIECSVVRCSCSAVERNNMFLWAWQAGGIGLIVSDRPDSTTPIAIMTAASGESADIPTILIPYQVPSYEGKLYG